MNRAVRTLLLLPLLAPLAFFGILLAVFGDEKT